MLCTKCRDALGINVHPRNDFDARCLLPQRIHVLAGDSSRADDGSFVRTH
jgi:hypothetical protein